MRLRFVLCIIISPCLGLCQVTQYKDTIETSYLDELVVSANKIPEPRRMVAQQVQLVDAAAMQLINPQTSADLLQNTGAVFIQRSQQGGGSPSLRGFEASRVLLVIDGVRMNNAIFRSGHLQNVITLDNNILDRVEVLFGPSSTVYGSDALGGVVHFYTREPTLSSDSTQIKGGAFLRYASVNQEKTAHVDFSFGGKQIGSLTSFTISDFGNLKMGKKVNPALGESFGLRKLYVQRSADNTSDQVVNNPDPYVQKFTGYRQYDILQKFIVKTGERSKHVVNLQYSTSSNVPRYDRQTDLGVEGFKNAQWYYGPQKRMLGAYKFEWDQEMKLADHITGQVSYQRVEESRHTRKFNSNDLKHRNEQVNVWALTIDLQKKLKRHAIRYGFDSQFNKVKSTAFQEDIVTSETSSLDTRYPNGKNKLNYWAVYASHTWNISQTLIFTDGLRVGGSSLVASFQDKTFFPFPFDDINQTTTYGSGNLGLIYAPTSWKISLLGSTGFRVPNIDDLSKVFDSRPGILIIPNPHLKPEKTINGDLSVTKFFGHKARLEAVAFMTRFYDAIVIRPDSFLGASTITYEGQTADVMSSQNAGRAYLFGYSFAGTWDFAKNFSAKATYNYTYGRVLNDGDPKAPLDHVPPTFGRVGINYNHAKWDVEAFCNFNGWKKIKDYGNSGEDNQRYATTDGMPSWYTINMRASYNLLPKITLQLGVDNLFDLQYRTFASGINAPGRNIMVTVRGKL